MLQSVCERPHELQRLLDTLRDYLAAQVLEPISAYYLAEKIFLALDNNVGTMNSEKAQRVAACRHFSTAIDNMRTGAASVRPFADVLTALEPKLTWRHRRPANNLMGNESDTIANSILVGPNGLEQRDDIQIGMTIMAANTLFSDHRHPPQEIYAVLSKGEWRQKDQPWYDPGAGGFVYNPPNIIHAFKSVDGPLLAIWCLD